MKKTSRRKFLGLGLGTGALAVSIPFLVRPGWTEGKITYGDFPYLGEIGLMHYNIAVGSGEEGCAYSLASEEEKKSNLDKIVSTALKRRAAILSLNEVDFGFSIDGKNQEHYLASQLAERWGSAYFVGGRHADFPTFRFGNAIISRYPIDSYQPVTFGHGLGRMKHQWKGFVRATVKLGRNHLDIVTTHLHDGDELSRQQETETLVDYLTKLPNPFILMGDLNDVPGSRAVQKISEAALPVENILLTNPSRDPERKIDYIFTSYGLKTYGSYAVCSDASDHCAIGCFLYPESLKKVQTIKI